MSEGNVAPPKPVVPEAHEVDTYHVPKVFFESVRVSCLRAMIHVLTVA